METTLSGKRIGKPIVDDWQGEGQVSGQRTANNEHSDDDPAGKITGEEIN